MTKAELVVTGPSFILPGNEQKETASVVFINGIMPRSGTHFLANLLCQHPDCEKSVIPEDCFLTRADQLAAYANSIRHSWDEQDELKDNTGYLDMLMENLGGGLINFLRQARDSAYKKERATAEKRLLVTKTPHVDNISLFFKLFPDEKLIIIVRDGRTLVESIVRSFNYNRDEAIATWASAARKIARFTENQKEGKFLVVKYEDLHTDTEAEMRKILNYLELDAGQYDFKAAANLPVVGSATFKRGEAGVHWMPVKKTDEFKPTERAAGWTRAQHERFNRLAKNELIYFGYEPVAFADNKTLWRWRNMIVNIAETLKGKAKKISKY